MPHAICVWGGLALDNILQLFREHKFQGTMLPSQHGRIKIAGLFGAASLTSEKKYYSCPHISPGRLSLRWYSLLIQKHRRLHLHRLSAHSSVIRLLMGALKYIKTYQNYKHSVHPGEWAKIQHPVFPFNRTQYMCID